MNRRKALATIGVVGVGSLSGCLFGGNDEDTEGNGGGNQDSTGESENNVADSVEEDPDERSYDDIWAEAVTNYDEHTTAQLNLSIDWETGTFVSSEDVSENPEYEEYVENGRLVEISTEQSRTVRYNLEDEQFYVEEESTFGQFRENPLEFLEQSYQRELYYQDETLYGLITYSQTEPEEQWVSEPRSFDSVESDLLSLPQFPDSIPDNATTNDTGATVEYEFSLSDSELLLNSVESEGYYLSGVQKAEQTNSTVVVTVNLETVQIEEASIEFLGQTDNRFNESIIGLEFDYGVSVDYTLPQSPSDAGEGEFYHPRR